jgi:hypothetical protein
LAADAARRHTGLDVVVLDDGVWERLGGRYSFPGYLKLHVFDLVDADDVLIFDADAIHINAWRPQEYAGRPEVVGVPDRYIGELSYEAGVPPSEYINAGMMIVNRRHHEPLLRLARELYARGERPIHHEQTLINKARRLLGIPLLKLDERFNHLRFYDDPEFDATRTVIAHWTPHDDPAPVEAFCRQTPVLCRKNAAAVAGKYIDTIGPYPSGYDGRGIVTCAGGTGYNTCAWVLINRLRDLGCRLPIQVWYLGERERDDEWVELVRPLGVECVDAHSLLGRFPHPSLGGWQLKPYSVLHCAFREVLFLDADNVPLRDPTFLFESEEYRAAGAIFWPDLEITRTARDSPRWDVLGVPYREEPEFESGQLVIDKARCWRPLMLCNWYNERSHFFYRILYGDKDTFRFAWRRLEQPFAMPVTPARLIPLTFCQHDFGGERLFQHRVQEKWSLLGNSRVANFVDEAECIAHVDKLRGTWNPMIRHMPPVSASRRRLMKRLAGGATFERVGRVSWPIELLPSGLVGQGRSDRLCLWWPADGEVIFASSEGNPEYRLKRQQDGTWLGPSPDRPRETVRLTMGVPVQ